MPPGHEEDKGPSVVTLQQLQLVIGVGTSHINQIQYYYLKMNAFICTTYAERGFHTGFFVWGGGGGGEGEGNLGSHKTKTTGLKMSILKIELVKCTIT